MSDSIEDYENMKPKNSEKYICQKGRFMQVLSVRIFDIGCRHHSKAAAYLSAGRPPTHGDRAARRRRGRCAQPVLLYFVYHWTSTKSLDRILDFTLRSAAYFSSLPTGLEPISMIEREHRKNSVLR